MVGLLLLAASLLLALILPAAGIETLDLGAKADAVILAESQNAANSNDPLRRHTIHVYILLAASGMAGLAMWLIADHLGRSSARRATGFKRRSG
jgi:hypothetical protein